MKKVFIGQTRYIGKGLFSGETVQKGEKILNFEGKKIRLQYTRRNALRFLNSLGVGYQLWLNPRRGHYGRYINHSCKPNAGILGSVTFVALRRIKKGEEITFDYSISEEGPFWKMVCRCGEPDCRKVIENICSLPRVTYRKYLPYVPRYFQGVYRRCR